MRNIEIDVGETAFVTFLFKTSMVRVARVILLSVAFTIFLIDTITEVFISCTKHISQTFVRKSRRYCIFYLAP